MRLTWRTLISHLFHLNYITNLSKQFWYRLVIYSYLCNGCNANAVSARTYSEGHITNIAYSIFAMQLHFDYLRKVIKTERINCFITPFIGTSWVWTSLLHLLLAVCNLGENAPHINADMYLRMYIFAYVRIYVCTYVCMYICMCVCM